MYDLSRTYGQNSSQNNYDTMKNRQTFIWLCLCYGFTRICYKMSFLSADYQDEAGSSIR